jgi:hypothetical protein
MKLNEVTHEDIEVLTLKDGQYLVVGLGRNAVTSNRQLLEQHQDCIYQQKQNRDVLISMLNLLSIYVVGEDLRRID